VKKKNINYSKAAPFTGAALNKTAKNYSTYFYGLKFETIKIKCMIRNSLITLFAAFLLFSCAAKTEKKEAAEPMHEHSTSAATEKNLYKDVVFDSKKDFACGMPISAGVSDTAHYKEKVYGFCSKECKDEFVKSPDSYITAK